MRLRLRVGGELAPGDQVAGQPQLLAPRPEHAPGGLEALVLAQRVADLVALGLEEREAHRAADEHAVRGLQERVEHADLVRHLGAADHGHERPLRILEDALERAHLALQQPSGRARQQVGDGLRRRVRPVRGAERVVHVRIGQRGVASRQLGIVLRLAGLEAHVLEHHDVAVGDVVERRRRARPPRPAARPAGRPRGAARTSRRAPWGGRGARPAAAARPSPAAPSASAARRGSANRR